MIRMEQPMPTMPKPRTAPPPPIPTNQQLASNQARQEKRGKANFNLEILQTELIQRASDWRIGARQVGKAYKTADNFYRDTLEKKKASDALEIQIFFSILTVVTSGALGWMSVAASKAMEGLRVEDAMSDARDATLQALSGEVFSANSPLIFPPTPDSTVSQDPQNFQSDLENKVDHLLKKALLDFNGIRRKYRDLPLSDWDKYDTKTEETAHRDWRKMADELAGEDDLPSENWMARELERGRWAKYVLDNHSYRDFGIFQTADTPDDVGSAVRNRLKELGVTAAVPPMRHVYGRAGIRGDEVDEGQGIWQLWNWAKNYELRKFTDEKKKPGGGGGDHK
jgi:hypothetical protein